MNQISWSKTIRSKKYPKNTQLRGGVVQGVINFVEPFINFEA